MYYNCNSPMSDYEYKVGLKISIFSVIAYSALVIIGHPICQHWFKNLLTLA